MPRGPRLKGEYSVYHIILRGNERREIFYDDNDKLRFLKTVARMKRKYDFKVYGYCLMNNHVHMIIDVVDNDISQIMKSINVSYVRYFNVKYERVGHLFQDRFKSQLVLDDPYLLELSRYIHRNPVEAKIVKTPEEYPWSSYNIYTGQAKDHLELVDFDMVLGILSPNRHTAVKEYVDYVKNTRNREQWQEEICASIMDVNWDWEDDGSPGTQEKARQIVEEIAEQFDLSAEQILAKRTPYRYVRNAAISALRQKTNLSLSDIGELFGGLSYSTVSKILNSTGKK
ncbi:MAG: transposase [Thermoanaerobacteraceae bacterium]|nr:transposase [Thermoanaerobacteraceae bacterium]